jgi:hemerythrin-like domain-containing protein
LGKKSPVEVLLDEHSRIQSVLFAFDNFVNKIGEVKSLSDEDTEKLLSFVGFFSLFADQLHHEKEEKILFPLMEKRGFSPYQGPTLVMREEHEYARELIAHMAATLNALSNLQNQEDVISEFKKSANAYIDLMREHIEKENHCLFPMALSALNEEDLNYLGEKFLRVDEDVKFSEVRNFESPV